MKSKGKLVCLNMHICNYQFVQTYMNTGEKSCVGSKLHVEQLLQAKLTELISRCGFEDKVVGILFR